MLDTLYLFLSLLKIQYPILQKDIFDLAYNLFYLFSSSTISALRYQNFLSENKPPPLPHQKTDPLPSGLR